MSNRCAVCGIDTIFYIWSTSRNFNRKQLVNTFSNEDNNTKFRLLNDSYPVCFHCVEKYGLTNK
jgi:hypothetical protein